MRPKPQILVILGPTATGKSDLAVRLAKKHNGEVISADSRQVFKGMDIGTGKITKREMSGVKHHLLDVADPRKPFSVVQYCEQAETAIREILDKGKLPIICGGTGFYIEALIDGVILPEVPADLKLREILNQRNAADLFLELKLLDPNRARNIDPHNKRRLIRAIEIAKTLGRVPRIKKQNKYKAVYIGLKLDPETLREKIHTRLDKRIRAGMMEEVRDLHKKGLTWKRMEELGLEYRYVSRCQRGFITRKEMAEQLENEIRHYAKRQMTWFRRNDKIAWFSPGSPDIDKHISSVLK